MKINCQSAAIKSTAVSASKTSSTWTSTRPKMMLTGSVLFVRANAFVPAVADKTKSPLLEVT